MKSRFLSFVLLIILVVTPIISIQCDSGDWGLGLGIVALVLLGNIIQDSDSSRYDQTNNTMSNVQINNDTNTIWYFYLDGKLQGKIYPGDKIVLKINKGCHQGYFTAKGILYEDFTIDSFNVENHPLFALREI